MILILKTGGYFVLEESSFVQWTSINPKDSPQHFIFWKWIEEDQLQFPHTFTKENHLRVVAEIDETKQIETDKWKGLAYDVSDDQQDIRRGKGMVDSIFQALMGASMHNAIMSSYDYISTTQ